MNVITVSIKKTYFYSAILKHHNAMLPSDMCVVRAVNSIHWHIQGGLLCPPIAFSYITFAILANLEINNTKDDAGQAQESYI